MTKMTKKEAAMLGGEVNGIQSRLKALERYYKNPNKCKHCGLVIIVDDHQKVQDAQRKAFCNRECWKQWHHSDRLKKWGHPNRWENCRHDKICVQCKSTFLGGSANLCPCCRNLARNMKLYGKQYGQLTLGELRSRHKNYTGYRSKISFHARLSYVNSNLPMACSVCGYIKWVDIAHRKPVSDFDNSATVDAVNDIKNLVPLCKNHHWEFDHVGLVI